MVIQTQIAICGLWRWVDEVSQRIDHEFVLSSDMHAYDVIDK